jgi:hypothetical protein
MSVRVSPFPAMKRPLRLDSRFPRAVLFACVVSPFLFSGCARTYSVQVDAIHDPSTMGTSGQAYRIVPRQPGFEQRDRDYPQAVAMIENALAGQGMYQAPNDATTEVIIEIDYGVGHARTEIVSERSPLPSRIDPILSSPGMRRPSPLDPNSVMLPDGRIGTAIVPEDTLTQKQVYDKHLTIAAREAKPGPNGELERGRELWRVVVTIEESKDDMAQTLPVLVGAAVDYIGTSTTSKQSVRIGENAEQVVFVRGSP